MSKKRLLTYGGKTLSVDEWARASGVPPATIRSRLDLLGWDVERALSEPVKVRFRGGGRKATTAAARACPPLRRDKSGRAFVRWSVAGRQHVRRFGAFGSAEASAAYQRFQSLWAAGLASVGQGGVGVSVEELAASWLSWCRDYYRKGDKPTSELSLCVGAVRLWLRITAGKAVASIGPDDLRAAQQKGIADQLARKTINCYCSRIVRMHAWGESRTVADGRPLVPSEVVGRLRAVEPLARGRSRAVERPKVRSVDWRTVEATLPKLGGVKYEPGYSERIQRLLDLAAVRAETLRRLVLLHWHTGMRSSELLGLRSRDVEKIAPDVWRYVVPDEIEKTAHMGEGRERCYYLGPRAIEQLSPLLANKTTSKNEPIGRIPSLRAERWGTWVVLDRHRYRQEIWRACDLAGVSRWNPHRLRKARATEIDKAVGGGGPGARAAAAAIGDTVETVRRHYLDGNDEPLIELARRTG